jgi:hypothetical protein
MDIIKGIGRNTEGKHGFLVIVDSYTKQIWIRTSKKDLTTEELQGLREILKTRENQEKTNGNEQSKYIPIGDMKRGIVEKKI